jgi:hypothetical protein
MLCEPLVHALKKGIKTRFGDVMADGNAQLAAIVVHGPTNDGNAILP